MTWFPPSFSVLFPQFPYIPPFNSLLSCPLPVLPVNFQRVLPASWEKSRGEGGLCPFSSPNLAFLCGISCVTFTHEKSRSKKCPMNSLVQFRANLLCSVARLRDPKISLLHTSERFAWKGVRTEAGRGDKEPRTKVKRLPKDTGLAACPAQGPQARGAGRGRGGGSGRARGGSRSRLPPPRGGGHLGNAPQVPRVRTPGRLPGAGRLDPGQRAGRRAGRRQRGRGGGSPHGPLPQPGGTERPRGPWGAAPRA